MSISEGKKNGIIIISKNTDQRDIIYPFILFSDIQYSIHNIKHPYARECKSMRKANVDTTAITKNQRKHFLNDFCCIQKSI